MSAEKDISQIVSDLGVKINEALRPLLEIVASEQPTENISVEGADMPKIIEKNAELAAGVEKIANEVATLCGDVQKLSEQMQEFSHKEKINKELHEELQKYKGGLRKEFIMPLLKSIIREYDRATQLHNFYVQKTQEEPQNELFAKLLKEFEIMGLSLLDLLDNYNLIAFSVKEGDDYLIKEHKIQNVIETEEAEKDGKIAKCLTCGFRDMSNEMLIRQADVTVYKLNS